MDIQQNLKQLPLRSLAEGVGIKYLMSETDYKQGAVIALGIFVLLAMGALYMAYGDDIDEKYYDVPFECKEFISTQETILGNKTTYLLDCKKLIEELIPPKIKVIIDDCDEECEKLLEKVKECREDPECEDPKVDPPYIPEDDLTEEQNELLEEAEKIYTARCVNEDNLNKADTAFCNLYAERDLCERGYLESEPIQTHDFFLTSNWKVGIWTMFDYKTERALSIMNQAVEECTAQKKLQVMLGAWYYDLYVATIIDAVPTHTELAANVFQPIHPLELTPAVHATSIKVAENTRCTERQFQSTWKDYDCKQEVIESCRMYSDSELMVIYETQWRPEFLTTPIKVYYQEIFDKCMDMMAANEPKDQWDYRDTQAWINADNYLKDSINAIPIGIPKSGVIITDCGDQDGECRLVYPAK